MTTSTTGSKESGGFTLVEVLLAVVIVTAGVVGVISVSTTALHAVGVAGEKLQAIHRLEGEVVSIRGVAELEGGLSPNAWSGDWPFPKQARWDAQASASADQLTALQVRANWPRSGRDYSVQLETVIHAPLPEGEGQ